MRFNLKVIGNIIGILLMINGFLMLTAVPFGIYHIESSWKGILLSSLINSAIGFFLYYSTKNNDNKELRKRDGYLIVTSSWIIMSFFGMLPYILTGQIPGIANAFFETVSGYTTTGATILDDIESLGLLKVDVLSLGMLSAIRKCFSSVKEHYQKDLSIASITKLFCPIPR